MCSPATWLYVYLFACGYKYKWVQKEVACTTMEERYTTKATRQEIVSILPGTCSVGRSPYFRLIKQATKKLSSGGSQSDETISLLKRKLEKEVQSGLCFLFLTKEIADENFFVEHHVSLKNCTLQKIDSTVKMSYSWADGGCSFCFLKSY